MDQLGTEPESDSPPITALLERAAQGDVEARNAAFQHLYAELRTLARRRLASGPERTLGPTALVHEVFLRLFGGTTGRWESRHHFLRVASRAMRSVVVDHARRQLSAKRGGRRRRVEFETGLAPISDAPVDALQLDEALAALETEYPEHAEVVQLRIFAGLSMEEIAACTGTPKRTVERQWTFARLWLGRRLG